jgi:hypothetical protein
LGIDRFLVIGSFPVEEIPDSAGLCSDAVAVNSVEEVVEMHLDGGVLRQCSAIRAGRFYVAVGHYPM